MFRTVYKIARMQRPFVDLPVDINLQILKALSIHRDAPSNHYNIGAFRDKCTFGIRTCVMLAD